MEDPSTKEVPRVLNVLEALKQASRDLQASSDDSISSTIKALLEIEIESETILSKDRNLSTPSQMLVFILQNCAKMKSLKVRRKSSDGININPIELERIILSCPNRIKLNVRLNSPKLLGLTKHRIGLKIVQS
ncbi:hypothetical protein Dsin_012316 [Dipteronia sinensis]|uniref:Uncharacterized protein n=1 Tax=Dipteronia sinensis TaxID=43782 RepID=A0AAE0E7W9_9ROSI|nr:hypothetical protein Dsin_012316 [Dipteronia sinensis]